jgi:hypothetical protein
LKGFCTYVGIEVRFRAVPRGGNMSNLFVFIVSFFALKIQETGDPLGAEEDHAPASWLRYIEYRTLA